MEMRDAEPRGYPFRDSEGPLMLALVECVECGGTFALTVDLGDEPDCPKCGGFLRAREGDN
jgi:hypothetical protein